MDVVSQYLMASFFLLVLTQIRHYLHLNRKIGFGVITIAILSFIAPALALEPIDSYCIVQKPVEEGEQTKEQSLYIAQFVKNASVEFEANEEQYRIDKFDGGGLTLYRSDNEEKLMSVAAKQYEYSREIHNIALGKSGWIWIDGYERDYMANVDANSFPPTISNPEEISFLTKEPCSKWGFFWMEDACRAAQGKYSYVLDRIFVKGYRITTLKNTNLIAMEIIDGKRQFMPRALRKAKFYADVPQLNGVLFRGPLEEALFYDGHSVTNLLEDYDIKPVGTPTLWTLVATKNSGQVFLTNTALIGNPQFLIKINKNLSTNSVSLLYKKPVSKKSFFIFPNKKRLWIASQFGIVTEVDDGMRYIAIVSKPSLYDSKRIYQTVNGDIRFIVENEMTGTALNYLLVRKNDTEDCEFDLNGEEAVALDNQ